MPPKRKAEQFVEDDYLEDEGLDARGSPSKKQMVEDDVDFEDDEAEFDDISDDDDGTHEEGESIATASQNSADSNNPGANTPRTSVSTKPRRKFPSDYKIIECDWPGCNQKFNRPARLLAHKRSHINDRPFICPEEGCDKAYIEEKHLRQHIQGTHKGQRPYACQHVDEKLGPCDKAFLTATRLKRHQATHEGKDQYRCKNYPPCTQTFRKHNTLERHIRVEHKGGKAYICMEKDCDAGFDSQGALRNHTKREHSTPEFWCEECASEVDSNGQSSRVGFPTLAQLQAHIRAEHLKCAFCDLKCKGQAALEKHIENFHSDSPTAPKKSFPCEYEGCPKTFSKRSNMAQHVRNVHQGHRFICGQVEHAITTSLEGWSNDQGCGQNFTTKANLETHIRHVHLGQARPRPTNNHPGMVGSRQAVERNYVFGSLSGADRPLRCTVPGCTSRFARQVDLDDHLQTHTANLEPYEAAIVGLAAQPNAVMHDQQDPMHLPHRGPAPLPFQGSYQPVIQRQEASTGMIFGDNNDNNTGGQSQFAPQFQAPASNYPVPVPDTHSHLYPLQDPGFLSLSQTQIGNNWVRETEDLPVSDLQQCVAVDPALGLNRLG